MLAAGSSISLLWASIILILPSLSVKKILPSFAMSIDQGTSRFCATISTLLLVPLLLLRVLLGSGNGIVVSNGATKIVTAPAAITTDAAIMMKSRFIILLF